MKLKKLMALLLALAMVLALAACGGIDTNDGGKSAAAESSAVGDPGMADPSADDNSDPADPSADGDPVATDSPADDNSAAANPLAGKWEAKLALDGGLMGVDDFDGEFQICVLWEFGDDGDYELSVDEDKLHSSIADLEDSLIQYMEDKMYGTFELMGLNKEQTDAAMVDQYDMTVSEYVRATVEDMNVEESILGQVDTMSEQGEYRVEDGKLYVKAGGEGEEVSFDFTVSGGKLELRSDDDDFAGMLEIFGLDTLVLEKV